MSNQKKIDVRSEKGFSLVEMLVVVFVFSIVAVITIQSLASTLKSTNKSESIIVVRENVDYAVSTMERLLRNAQSASCVGTDRLNYTNDRGVSTYFQCLGDYIASGSATTRLTSNEVVIDCSAVFTCPPTPAPPSPRIPPTIEIVVRGSHRDFGTTTEGALVTSTTRIQLRTYGQ